MMQLTDRNLTTLSHTFNITPFIAMIHTGLNFFYGLILREILTHNNDNGIDFFFVTETWFSDHGSEMKTAELPPS